ncbi:putative squalene epoxidase [Phaeomoniella chlamydospora]|uniref:Squalene monooxygenase n=1 Tax=Phaeomoniella chlamydospora TaxID=158046 RepID=A0A0G2HLA3_PHACM|nr:putative squalene epoxidase [Phaeomoniella chlamydospora]
MPLILDTPSETSSQELIDHETTRRRLHHEADVVIVGAGVLGSALAVAFGDQGRSVILLERSLKEPDRIVGELLQPGGVDALEKLGLQQCLEGIDAVSAKGYNVIFHGREVYIPYPLANPGSGTDNTRREGRSFHHGRFIQKLREAALSHHNVTVFETTVTSVTTSSYTNDVVGVESLTSGTTKDFFFGSLTVICDGYNSKFRKQYTHLTPQVKSKFWGLELIDAELSPPSFANVCISDRPPVLLYQIGTHETRALVDIPEGLPTASVAAGGVKGHLRNVVLPTLPSKVQPSFARAIEAGGLRSMPNSFLPSTTQRTPGLILLGDALNMRHPLTGGGMTVALNDVVLIRDLLDPSIVSDLGDTAAVLSAMKTFHWRRKQLTAVVNILAQALYSLFAANDPYLHVLQKGCFEYFQLGGSCVDTPVSLLSGLLRQPFALFYHFFAVAFYSILVMFKEAQLWEMALFPVLIIKAILVFWKACVVIIPYILVELRA